VGIDQVPHVELSREVARRFNFFYGPVFPVPDPLLTEVPKLLGIDGRKMSKSYDNAIFISDPPDEVRRKTSAMFTDPNRIRKSDPGNPDICNVFSFHKVYSDPETVIRVNRECRQATLGCVEDKKNLAETLVCYLAPLQEVRERFLQNPGLVEEILEDGCQRARSVATRTMEEVREAMKI
jgi:tryptophanyl-tRNA synthetase